MGGGGVIIDIQGGMQKKESPDFRFPEVGISGLYMYYNNSANTPIALVHLTINIFRQLPAFTCYFHCTTNDTLYKYLLLHLLLKMA